MNNRITAVDFTEEIYTSFKDSFVAKIVCRVDEICVEFSNGQKFIIEIKEI
ncbi:MAG: hypothetical protein K2H30_03485 [Clostridia bacterium]|nr:hypothetical protein [Clostridia bacterium]